VSTFKKNAYSHVGKSSRVFKVASRPFGCFGVDDIVRRRLLNRCEAVRLLIVR